MNPYSAKKNPLKNIYFDIFFSHSLTTILHTLNPQHFLMIHVPWIKYNLHRKAPKKLYSTRYKSIISICILHSTSFKKKICHWFFSLSFILLFSFFFSIKAGKFIIHTVEREVKKRIVEFVLISQGNILQITTCWETQWKENFPAAPYSICYMFTSMGIFFFLQILMNI